MTTTGQRLEFQYDLQDAQSVFRFPEEFARFLSRESTAEDVAAFLSLLEKYTDSAGDEDLNFGTICNIAAQFADIQDVSGLSYDENPWLTVPGAKTAEDVLQELDEGTRDAPTEISPEYPEVEVVVRPEDDVPLILFKAVIGLRKEGYRKASERLSNDIRDLIRTEPTLLELLHLVESYVFVDYEAAIEHANQTKRKELRT